MEIKSIKKLKLYGFNNLTKTFSFNMYDICYATSPDHRKDYIEYNDDCYSCHIAFTKNMTLTSGGARKDGIDSTFYFVKYEGRWAIADMIATTK